MKALDMLGGATTAIYSVGGVRGVLIAGMLGASVVKAAPKFSEQDTSTYKYDESAGEIEARRQSIRQSKMQAALMQAQSKNGSVSKPSRSLGAEGSLVTQGKRRT